MRRLGLACAALVSLGLASCGSGQNGSENAAATGEAGKKGFAALEEADHLSSIARLLKAAGLQQVIEGHGSYTIFAPSDEAYAALPEEQRRFLEGEEGRPQLIVLLRQHMAAGYLTATDLDNVSIANGGQAKLASLGAAPITVQKQDNSIVLGQGEGAARIVGEPVLIGNSIVHRIDHILPPPAS